MNISFDKKGFISININYPVQHFLDEIPEEEILKNIEIKDKSISNISAEEILEKFEDEMDNGKFISIFYKLQKLYRNVIKLQEDSFVFYIRRKDAKKFQYESTNYFREEIDYSMRKDMLNAKISDEFILPKNVLRGEFFFNSIRDLVEFGIKLQEKNITTFSEEEIDFLL